MSQKLKEELEEAVKALRNAYDTAVDNECPDSIIEEIATAYNIIEELI